MASRWGQDVLNIEHTSDHSRRWKVAQLTFVEGDRPVLRVWRVKPYARPGCARVHLEAHLPHDLD